MKGSCNALSCFMRYHYEQTTEYSSSFAEKFNSQHFLYNKCSLFRNGERGLAVIQQHFNNNLKVSWWGPIDPFLVSDIYNNPHFGDYFDEYSGVCLDGIFPTVTVRQIMWALRMKPLKKEYWETRFYCDINEVYYEKKANTSIFV